jgi:hypothetical protein
MLIMLPKTSEKDGSRLIRGCRKRIRCPFFSIVELCPGLTGLLWTFSPPLASLVPIVFRHPQIFT